ncbi:MAG: hypothetical protein AAB466_02800 [Verrucomicrobiota bacterium]
MRNFVVRLILVGLVLSAVCRKSPAASPPVPEVLVRFHFVGAEQLNANTNLATLKGIWSLPPTVELRGKALQKLSAFAGELLTNRMGLTNPLGAARLINPLLEDLLQAETHLEIRRSSHEAAEWTLALQLQQERAQLWQNNLSNLMALCQAGTPIQTTLDGFSGWEAKLPRETNVLRCLRLGQWTLLVFGPERLRTNYGVFPELKTKGRPLPLAKDYFLEAEADFPRLAQGLPASPATEWPQTHLLLSAKGDHLRSEMKLRFAKKGNWPLEKWQIPTNTIRDPLVSFTAGQGVGPWLSQLELLKPLELNPAPNQFFAWAQAYSAFHVYGAMPVSDATSVLNHFTKVLLPKINTNLQERAVGELVRLTNQPGVFWRGLPIIVPFVHPSPEPGGHFIYGGIFPAPVGTNLPPPELFAEFASRTNLLYYDWEITQARLAQLRPLFKLLSIVTSKPFQNTNSLAEKWLGEIEPSLGNTTTEISVTSPQELTLVRKSHLGLTGVELIALAHWAESPDFPRLNFDISFGPKRDLPKATAKEKK